MIGRLVRAVRAHGERRRADRAAYLRADREYLSLFDQVAATAAGPQRAALYLALSSAAGRSADTRRRVDRRPLLRGRCYRAGHQESYLLDVLSTIEEDRATGWLGTDGSRAIYLLWPDLWSATADILQRLAASTTDEDYAAGLDLLRARLRTVRVLHRRGRSRQLVARDAVEVLHTVADVLRGQPFLPSGPVSTDTDTATPPSRAQGRAWAVSGSCLLIAVAAVLGLTMSTRPTATDAPTTTPTPDSTASRTPTGSAADSAIPTVPPPHGDHPGREVQVLVLVPPATSPDCVHMRITASTPATWLLTGTWPHHYAGTAAARQTQLWVLTGHAEPIPAQAPHHPPAHPRLGGELAAGCAPAPPFRIDQAQTVPDWLTAVSNAVFGAPPLTVSPLPSTPPATVTPAPRGHPLR